MNTPNPYGFSVHQVAHSFQQSAADYQSVAKLQTEVAKRLAQRLENHKNIPETIIDLGCGTGLMTQKLREFYPKSRIYALDIAPAMLDEAEKHCASGFSLFNKAKSYFCCADAAQLPFANQSIDLVVSNLMLQWCPDYERVFAEAARVLKPDGALLFSTLGPDTLKELRAAWAKVDAKHTHVNEFIDLHKLGDALLQQGLRQPIMDIDWLTVTFKDGMQMMRQLKTLGAHNITEGRPRGLTGRKTLQAVLDEYDTFRAADGTLPATYEVTYGYALGRDLSFQTKARDGVVHVPISTLKKVK